MLLLVELRALPAKAGDLEQVLQELVAIAAGEAWVMAYAAYRCCDEPGVFVLVERYANRQAWEQHLSHPAVARALERFDPLLAGPPELKFCDPLAAVGVEGPR